MFTAIPGLKSCVVVNSLLTIKETGEVNAVNFALNTGGVYTYKFTEEVVNLCKGQLSKNAQADLENNKKHTSCCMILQ